MSKNISFSAKQCETTSTPKKTLVLDLDETLIHARVNNFENASAIATVSVDSKDIIIYISKRPGLREFLTTMSDFYTLILYTAATKQYAHAVLKATKIESFFSRVYHREHCLINNEKKFVKSLGIMGKEPSDILLVDDSQAHVDLQPNNILIVKPFRGESEDQELPLLAEFLKELSQKDDVRSVRDRFAAFKIQEEFKKSQNEKSQILGRKIEAKFMQKLKISIQPEATKDNFDANKDSSESTLARKLPFAQQKLDLASSKSPDSSEKSIVISSDRDPLSSDIECALPETPRLPHKIVTGNFLWRSNKLDNSADPQTMIIKV